MIPPLIQIIGAPHRVLPPGVHSSTMTEIGERFATNETRRRLFSGFALVADALLKSGCNSIYLDGSFTTDKPEPNDYDGCWDPKGVDVAKLDPVLLDFTNRREAQKRKYFGEMFIATTDEISGKTFLDFFQTERSTGKRKGILLLQPQGLVVSP
jgi:hypothetical protein